MRWFKNLRTVVKLLLAFALIAGLTAFVGYKGATAAGEVEATLDTTYEKDMLGILAMQRANINRLRIGREIRTVILLKDKDKAQKEQLASQISKYFSDLDVDVDEFDKKMLTEQGKVAAAKFREDWPGYKSMLQNVLGLALAEKDDEAFAALEKGAEITERVNKEFNALVDLKEKHAAAAHEESQAAYAKARTMLFTIVGVSVLLSFGVGIFIAQLISKPLASAVEVLGRVADRDLTARLDVDTEDEVGRMAKALNRATDAMRTILRDVRESADHMALSAQQLAAASEQLASGAQEQASSLEETSATMEEITSTIKQNADNAKQANQVANGSRDTAQKGGQVVSEAVSAMGMINESSKNIAEIITTIDEIAFQTNLLALNAAVEAARAGEQGRGFAVVATEVRNLAQRSATSAKEIKRLIQDSVSKVENGSTLVNKSGETLREIVESVKRVTDIVAEIAAASQEQSTGVEQVNKAVSQMDQVTQSNSSQTEELSATAQSLASSSQQLQAMVARFRLDAEGMEHASASPAVKAGASELRTGLPARKPLLRRAAAAASGAAAGAGHVSAHALEHGGEPGNAKEADGFEEF